MKVISIGTDSKLFEDNSSVLVRQKEYASKIEDVHVVVFTYGGYKEKHINNLHIYPTNSKIFSLFFGWWKIRKIIRDKKDFVITTQDPFETGLLGVIIKILYKIPLQVQVHTDYLDKHFKNSILNKIRVFISKLVIPKADRIRVVSSVIRDSLVKEYSETKEKIDIFPIWVDIENIQKQSVVENIATPQSILMVSRLTVEKNIILAIESFNKVLKLHPNEILYIVGDGDQKELIWSKVKKFGLTKKVKIVGWEKQEVIMSLYNKSKIFLLTSDFEGYGMTLVEAGASGCPIVTTKVGLAKTDLFKDGINSYVCPVGDVDCLSEKISILLKDENKRKTFTQNIREEIKSLAITREEYVTKYIGLLEKINK